MSLSLKNITKSYGTSSIFSNFSIDFPEGTITCILGPSGCGKTTLLNIIAQTQFCQYGDLSGLEGKVISYIFQEPRLLPWRTVKGNVELPLMQRYTPKESNEIADRFIRLVELNDFENYYPSQLSGGMRQRVSIARAFAYPSDIILMDEPLKGLDIKLKINIMRAFTRLWQFDRRTVIFVTHDVDEALLLGSEIIVFGNAPVAVKASLSISTPQEDRVLTSNDFLEHKTFLQSIIGN